MPLQFDSRSMLATVTAIAVLCALGSWVLNPGAITFLSSSPLPFVPTIPMMGIGICLIPFFCLPAYVVAGGIVLRTSCRPYSAIVFFGLQFVVLFADVSFWEVGLRFLATTLIASAAMTIETVARKLPKLQLVASGIAILISVAWYFAIVCVVASASV